MALEGQPPRGRLEAVNAAAVAGVADAAPAVAPQAQQRPPAATMAASPPLDPPGERSSRHGLLARPCSGLSVSKSVPSWGTLVLPRTIAPARRRRDQGAVGRRRRGRRASAGRPWSAPGDVEHLLDRDRHAVQRPEALAALAGGVGSGASARACSNSGTTTAFSRPLTARMRAIWASATSRAGHPAGGDRGRDRGCAPGRDRSSRIGHRRASLLLRPPLRRPCGHSGPKARGGTGVWSVQPFSSMSRLSRW